ncbi:prostate stem cell antigen-like [Cyprinodon tularosa]|uniref:prostate stem cell antigen-like n=1 Tax=Cyprinodon tularosa TaxID=77115 RepID=UPI0018E1FE1B|nr:prostate stem cell antigen-like [Cyprinodon tularosa]
MLLSLVILFFLFSPVTSLKCFVCSSSTTNDECNQSSQSCQQPLDTCMTIVDTLGYMKAIVKQCSSSSTCKGAASTASMNADGNGNTINCCNYDMCNFSAAESVHSHMLLLLLTVGILLLPSL